jgi:hypothetical protein
VEDTAVDQVEQRRRAIWVLVGILFLVAHLGLGWAYTSTIMDLERERQQAEAARARAEEAAERLRQAAAGPVGLWAIPEWQVKALSGTINWTHRADGMLDLYIAPSPFYFDGETVTMHLITMKAWMWRSEDEYYRLKSKWVGQDLYYLPPFGKWTKLATYADGRFQLKVREVVWLYMNLPTGEVREEFRPLVKGRPKHDYSITATGNRDPERLKRIDQD